jgi:hypothetical protein
MQTTILITTEPGNERELELETVYEARGQNGPPEEQWIEIDEESVLVTDKRGNDLTTKLKERGYFEDIISAIYNDHVF